MAELDTAQLLAQLRDIHLPPAPVEASIWPVLLAAIVIVAAAAVLFSHHLRQRRSWATEAIAELNRIQRSPPALQLSQTATVLKRIVITHHSTATVRQLNGKAWLACLDQFFNTRYFTQGSGQIFGDALYRPDSSNTMTASTFKELRKLVRRRYWQT